MTKARQLADLGNAYDDGAITGSNMIINGGFSVSQRGDYTSASAVSNGVYYLDRWNVQSGIAGTLQDTGYKVKVVATSTGSGVLAIKQSIEDKNIHPHKGKVVTVSCKVTSNSSNARIVIYADNWIALGSQNDVHSGGGNEETLSATFTVPSDLSGFLQVRVGFENAASNGDPSVSSNDYFEVSEVKLEVGDTATPFEHRSYGDELARCQRYYANYKATTGQSHMAFPYSGFANSTTAELFGNHPAEMRVPPSVSFNSVSAFRVAQSASDQNTTDMNVDFISTSSMRLRPTVSTGLTAGQGVGLLNIPSTLAIINFDAEL